MSEKMYVVIAYSDYRKECEFDVLKIFKTSDEAYAYAEIFTAPRPDVQATEESTEPDLPQPLICENNYVMAPHRCIYNKNIWFDTEELKAKIGTMWHAKVAIVPTDLN